MRFTGDKPTAEEHFEFITPKASNASLFDNVITVEPEDRKTLCLRYLLQSAREHEAAIYWLSYNWRRHWIESFLLDYGTMIHWAISWENRVRTNDGTKDKGFSQPVKMPGRRYRSGGRSTFISMRIEISICSHRSGRRTGRLEVFLATPNSR